MRVTVIANRKDPTKVLALIQGETKKHGRISVPAYFPKNKPQPKVGQELDVMIVGVLLHKDENGHPMWGTKPKCFFIEEPSEKDIRIHYRGFECSGSMCRTDTSAFKLTPNEEPGDFDTRYNRALKTKYPKERRHEDPFISWVTPGRIEQYLIVAQQNSNDFYGKPRTPLTPGVGWCHLHEGRYRLSGVNSLAELNI